MLPACSLQYHEHVCHGVFDRRGTFSSAAGADETFLPLEQFCSIQPDPQDDGEARPALCSLLMRLHSTAALH